jgi:hypothetical protein
MPYEEGLAEVGLKVENGQAEPMAVQRATTLLVFKDNMPVCIVLRTRGVPLRCASSRGGSPFSIGNLKDFVLLLDGDDPRIEAVALFPEQNQNTTRTTRKPRITPIRAAFSAGHWTGHLPHEYHRRGSRSGSNCRAGGSQGAGSRIDRECRHVV